MRKLKSSKGRGPRAHSRLIYAKPFLSGYASAPPSIQKAFDKQALLLLADFHHPSLRTKKYASKAYPAHLNFWQSRVTKDWRFYFVPLGEAFFLVSIESHPK